MPDGLNDAQQIAAKGFELMQAGRFAEACDAFTSAITAGETGVPVWIQLAQALNNISFTSQTDGVRTWLTRLAAQAFIPAKLLHTPILRFLVLDPAFGQLWSRAQSPEFAFQAADLGAMADPLLATLLGRGAPMDSGLERIATSARRALLLSDLDVPALRCAVAQTALAGEFALAQAQDEVDRVDSISERILRDQQASLNDLSNYAGYRPLHLAPWAKLLPQSGWPAPYDALIRLALIEPAEEMAIRETIPRLGAIDGAVSASVQAMYEENPYPRWLTMAPPPPEPLPVTIGRLHPRADMRGLQWSEQPQILIAGCGTGKQAIECALRHPTASLLAIDLSLASLSFAKRKAIEMGVPNVEFAQADLTTLDLGERQFDLVESVGVLHHLEHPVEGWRRLTAMVRPGGLMTIGLYSRAARAWLSGLRVQFGLRSTPASIRDFRQKILRTDPTNPIVATPDFFTLSECRDLVFHVQETQFTLAEIQQIMSDLGLRFLGFCLSPQRLLQYDARFPKDPGRSNLDNWSAMEAEDPKAFAAMYQFWLMKEPNQGESLGRGGGA